MGRKSAHNLPPGIHLDSNSAYWATLEGDEAKIWRERYPERSLPRRKAATLKAALKLQRLLIDDLKAARDPNAENPKIADWVEICIDRKRKLSPATIQRYRQLLRWQIDPHPIGKLRLHQLMRRHVEAWVDQLMTQQRQDGRGALDPYTIARAFGLLRHACNLAIAEGLIVTNPCKGVELPRPDDEEIRPLDPAQVDRLLTLLDTLVGERPHRNAALYHVALRCGLRLGELVGLRWSDVDLERRELRVQGQIQKGERRRGKTEKSRRTVPLTTDTVRALHWHKQNQLEERNVSHDGWNAAGLVFCSEKGTPLNDRNIERQFDALLVRAQLPDIRFHDLRHTYASLSIAAGVDIFTLSRRMGHSSIAVTADRYGHLYAGHTMDIDALDRLIRRAS